MKVEALLRKDMPDHKLLDCCTKKENKRIRRIYPVENSTAAMLDVECQVCKRVRIGTTDNTANLRYPITQDCEVIP